VCVCVCMHVCVRACMCVCVRARACVEIISLPCKRAQKKRLYSAKQTYNFKEPTNRSHHIVDLTLLLKDK